MQTYKSDVLSCAAACGLFCRGYEKSVDLFGDKVAQLGTIFLSRSSERDSHKSMLS